MQPGASQAWAIACLLAIPNARGQDVFSSGGAPQGGQVVSSITDLHNGDCDLKIKNTRTGYVRSFTIPCGVSAKFKVVPSRDSSPQFKKALKDCLDSIKRIAAADRGSPVNRLLSEVENIPITIHQQPPSLTNITQVSAPGKAVYIDWGLRGGHYESDGASRIPCATLLHELTHAWENYNDLDNGELVAVRAENWLIWKLHGTQRTKYMETPLPVKIVVWPQAGSASPK